MVRLGDMNPITWDTVTERMEEVLIDLDFSADDVHTDWRPGARLSRIDRELYEQYGPLKDYILHPTTQKIVKLWDNNIDTNFFVEPEIPLTTGIVLIFMLRSRLSSYGMAFLIPFLMNINPLYTIILALIHYIYNHYGSSPKEYVAVPIIKVNSTTPTEDINIDHGNSSSSSSSSSSINNNSNNNSNNNNMDTEYDHVFIAHRNDISALYAAALLSKVGHKCCVVMNKYSSPSDLPPPTSGLGLPSVPTINTTTPQAVRYQMLLDFANTRSSSSSNSSIISKVSKFTNNWLSSGEIKKEIDINEDDDDVSSSSDDDDVNRVIFKPVGSRRDGYTSTIIVTKKLSVDDGNTNEGRTTLVLRTGEDTLINDIAHAVTTTTSTTTTNGNTGNIDGVSKSMLDLIVGKGPGGFSRMKLLSTPYLHHRLPVCNSDNYIRNMSEESDSSSLSSGVWLQIFFDTLYNIGNAFGVLPPSTTTHSSSNDAAMLQGIQAFHDFCCTSAVCVLLQQWTNNTSNNSNTDATTITDTTTTDTTTDNTNSSNNNNSSSSSNNNTNESKTTAAAKELLVSAAIALGDECLSPRNASCSLMLSLPAYTETGCSYPVGGLSGIQQQLISTIREAGGDVIVAEVRGIVVEPESTAINSSSDNVVLAARGVTIATSNSSSSSSSSSSSKEDEITLTGSVVSGVGILCTYLRLLPDIVWTYNPKPSSTTTTTEEESTNSSSSNESPFNQQRIALNEAKHRLNGIRESEPVAKVVFWLSGKATSLGISSCDYVEVPSMGLDMPASSASPVLQQATINTNSSSSGNGSSSSSSSGNGSGNTAAVSTAQAIYNANYVRIWSPSMKDQCHWKKTNGDSTHAVVVEFQVGEDLMDLRQHVWKHNIKSADSSSSSSSSGRRRAGSFLYSPFHSEQSRGSNNVCGGEIQISASLKNRLIERAKNKLLSVYPRCHDHIIATNVQPPSVGGHKLQESIDKYHAKVTSDTPIKDMFLCGEDVGLNGTVSASLQGGWLCANTVLGYTKDDADLGRTIISDLYKQNLI